MQVIPMSSNRIFIIGGNNICLSISDDVSAITIQREIDPNHNGGKLLQGTFYTYQEHHEKNTEHKLVADILRIDK